MNESYKSFPICPHFEKCAGCSEYLSLKPPLIWEEVLSFFSFFPSLNLHAGPPLYWRHRAKLAVRGTLKNPLIGLFKRFSHEVYPIPDCLVHHLNLNKAFNLVQKWMLVNGISPYEEKTGKGELRYLQGVVQRASGRVQLSFVFNSSREKEVQANQWRALIAKLPEEDPLLWHSLWMNFNDRSTNTIFGSDWIRISGDELLWEKFKDVDVCYGPESFGQANLPLFEQMLIRICELILPKARVAEFYAGVGAIGLFVASHCEWVRCSEINPFAEIYFQHALTKLPLKISSCITFISSSTKDALSILDDATVVIVDPPRKGLDAHFFKALKETSTLKQLLYISCGWDSFKKDYQKLFEDGWRVRTIDGYHFFPGSNHVELLVNFERI